MNTQSDTLSANVAEPVARRMLAAGFTAMTTGDGLRAWERAVDDKIRVMICDEDNGLGERIDQFFMVGIFHQNGEFIEDMCENLDAAIEWCEQAQDTLAHTLSEVQS